MFCSFSTYALRCRVTFWSWFFYWLQRSPATIGFLPLLEVRIDDWAASDAWLCRGAASLTCGSPSELNVELVVEEPLFFHGEPWFFMSFCMVTPWYFPIWEEFHSSWHSYHDTQIFGLRVRVANSSEIPWYSKICWSTSHVFSGLNPHLIHQIGMMSSLNLHILIDPSSYKEKQICWSTTLWKLPRHWHRNTLDSMLIKAQWDHNRRSLRYVRNLQDTSAFSSSSWMPLACCVFLFFADLPPPSIVIVHDFMTSMMLKNHVTTLDVELCWIRTVRNCLCCSQLPGIDLSLNLSPLGLNNDLDVHV